MVNVEVIATEELGDRSYLAHDGSVAVAVDPQRDIDRVEALLSALGLTLELVVETHIHNDYVTGGRQLATRTGARYVVNAEDPVAFDRVPVRAGDEIAVGAMTVRVVATPGHTFTHLSYVISDGDPAAAPAVFTGGSLLYGSVGRTDLVDPARTDELTRAQYHSVRHLAESLPGETAVYPTHGFGSFCSAAPTTGGPSGTIADERARNDAVLEPDEDAFVARLVAGLTAYPAYYAHMAPVNLRGPAPVDLSPLPVLDPAELAARIDAGEWVVDLRDRTAYAAQHLTGSVGIGLGPQFATWLGWVIPWDTPLTLIGESAEQVADAQRQLVRIGIDRPRGRATGTIDALADGRPTRSYPTATFDELRTARGEDPVIVDVRRDDEYAVAHIRGALHIPLPELADRLHELPDRRLWVHCQSAYRASIGASLLDRAGFDVVLVADEFPHAQELGLTD
ncbi:MBL fold metallo-hydrolase [Pseudonocardia petroleophila]|uniref:MBL fold metallo-hydrolase n=1 Tax=Pseudonocardia petroleophila TaxID=37331 RepID=A0A7G7MFP2_9PSEU|nr:MBL fold metallo-hydrolase [Pseudonocardia petroleophila]QNG51603.1 MBL fold metallo-hydrolase [Pseudonocardia petroleophila]